MRKRIFSSIFFFYSSLTHFCETKQDVKQEKNSVWRHIYINYSICKKVNFPGCSGSLPTENSKLLGFKVKNCFNISECVIWYNNHFESPDQFIIEKFKTHLHLLERKVFTVCTTYFLGYFLNLTRSLCLSFGDLICTSPQPYYCPSTKLRQDNVFTEVCVLGFPM